MGDLSTIVSRVMSQSERQLEVAAQNVANAATPGYKRQFAYMQAAQTDAARADGSSPHARLDLTPGKLVNTGRPLDVAVSGAGFFVVGSAEEPAYTRSGQFQRDAMGRLVTVSGEPVQADGGGDILLKSDAVQILEDGTILDQGEPSGKLAFVDFKDSGRVTAAAGGLLMTPADNVLPLESVSVHQRMLESSNVSTAADMISIMEALRGAETGQRLANMYDDLMGRVLSAVGES